MVALLVIGFILTCLIVDLLVIRSRKPQETPSPVMAPGMVFAQDGGEPVDSEEGEDAPGEAP